jgi:HEAT repeat protein
LTAAAKPWFQSKPALMLKASIGLALLQALPARVMAQVPPPAVPVVGPLDPGRAAKAAFDQDVQTIQIGQQKQRDDAAKRLVARQNAEGRAAILAALQIKQNQGAQLAAARAILDDPNPDPRWINPLGELLGIPGQAGGLEGPLTEAAAAALSSAYQGSAPPDHNAAIGRLKQYFVDPNAPSRLRAIRAMSVSADYRIAELLVSLAQLPVDRDRNNATDALQEMTLIADHARDAKAWAAWWAVQQRKPADTFRADLLDRRRRRAALTDEVNNQVAGLIQLADPKNQPEAFRRVLESSDPLFRAAGVRVAYQTFLATGQLPTGSLPRIRELVRDSSIEVRSAAAQTLGNVNDRPALETLLAQLMVEPDAGVRAVIMQALVPMRDVRAVPILLQMLNDPSIRTATVAAETIAKLGDVIRNDPGLRATTSAALIQTINNRGNQDADLKAACVEALVPLRMPEHRLLLENLLAPQQSPRTRRAALAGLGELRDPNLGNVVFGVVQNEQKDHGVRVAALDAMEKLNAGGYLPQLLELSRNQREDPGVRDRSRRVFESYLPLANDQQLIGWSGLFLQAAEHDRRIPVMKVQLKRAEDGKDLRAAAGFQQAIGEAYLDLAQPQNAIPFLKLALEYWQTNNGTPQALAGLRRPLMKALLDAKQYPEAARLAQDAMDRDAATQPDVINLIATEVENLNKNKQQRDAQRLAEEGLKIPKLDDRYKARLTLGLNEAKQTPERR